MKWKSLFFSKPGLVVLSTLVTLTLAVAGYEIYARIQYREWRRSFQNWGGMKTATIRSKDDRLLWEYRPYGVFGTIRFNRWGFREDDLPVRERPAGEYRIAFAGDSVTMGLGIEGDNVFVSKVQRLLEKRRPKGNYRTLNFGVDGYNALQVEQLIRTKVVPFEPNLIVYTMCLNDFDFVDSSGLKILFFDPPTSFLWRKLTGLGAQISDEEYHRYYFQKNQCEVFESIRNMKALTRQAGAAFYVAVLPIFPKDIESFNDYPLEDVHSAVDGFLSSNGIAHLDFLEVFKKQKASVRHWAGDIWHPNDVGNLLIASKLAEVLPLD